jgi:hypothetical protein
MSEPEDLKRPCKNGFILERCFNEVTPFSVKLQPYIHHQRYESGSKDQHFLHWVAKDMLSSWNNILVPQLTSSIKPHFFWRLIKENNVSIYCNETYEGYFGIELELFIPQNSRFNLAAIIKPMLDGIISAFHSYQGKQLDEVSKRLAINLSSRWDYISTLLLDENQSILGSRCVLHPFQKNVQWNPADDKCVVIKLICNYLEGNEIPRLNGKLFKVKEVPI